MRKLLIWDGDNCLWKGTIVEGETPHLPPGRRQFCENLSKRGVLQAISSRNRQADVDRAVHALGLSPYFLYNKGDLGGVKSQMVTQIVEDYGLSRYSDVVFVDDEAFNRAEVANEHPDVVVLHPDEDILQWFTKDFYTEEDRLRVRRYLSEQQRKQAANVYKGDYQEFLKSCETVMTVSTAIPEDLPRILDLGRRANRMAALKKNIDSLNVQARLNNCLVIHVTDKFGDYGLCGFLLWSSAYRISEIAALVVSCRLQGRGIGSALLGHWLSTQPDSHTAVAEWVETDYNKGLAGLFDWWKFTLNRGGHTVIATLDLWAQNQPQCRKDLMPSWVKIV